MSEVSWTGLVALLAQDAHDRHAKESGVLLPPILNCPDPMCRYYRRLEAERMPMP